MIFLSSHFSVKPDLISTRGIAIKESDWKLLSKLKPLALARLSQRILDEICAIATESRSAHERYLAVFAL